MDTTNNQQICVKCRKFHGANISCYKHKEFNVKRSLSARVPNPTPEHENFISGLIRMKLHGAKHAIVPRIFSPEECSQIKQNGQQDLKDIFRTITFDIQPNQPPINRQQKTFHRHWLGSNHIVDDPKLLPPCLLSFINYFFCIHPSTLYMNFKLLKSINPCRNQDFHCDDPIFTNRDDHPDLFKINHQTKHSYDNLPFVMIVALEPNHNPTSIWVAESSFNEQQILVPRNQRQIFLPQGTMIILRGDAIHAGAAYEGPYGENIRLFIGTGTYLYQNDGTNVAPIYSKEDAEEIARQQQEQKNVSS